MDAVLLGNTSADQFECFYLDPTVPRPSFMSYCAANVAAQNVSSPLREEK